MFISSCTYCTICKFAMLKILTYTNIVLVFSVITLQAGFFRIQDSL